jgi:DNA sulfur modification protein DndD
MKVEEIVLENFGPFVGRQTINLRTTPEAPLVVIDAPNGRGKTFIYRAIRWALYGRVFKGRNLIPESQLVNTVALSRDDEQMSVTLRCQSDGESLEIIRILTIDPTTRLPTASRLKIIRDGQNLLQTTSEHLIRGRLDESISRFFFFDGEMLQEYEDLLDDDSGDIQIVRTSVEAILGAPALSRLTKVLESIEKTTMKQIEATSKADESLRKLAEAQRIADEKVREIEEDLEKQRGYASDFQKQITQIENELNNYEYARDVLGRISAKEEELAKQKDIVLRSREEVQTSLQCWQIAVSTVAEHALEIVEPIREKVFETVGERERLAIRLNGIAESTDSGTCSVCHQPVTSHSAEALKVEMEEIQSKLRILPTYDQSYLNRLSRVVGRAKRTSRVAEKASLIEKGRNLESALQQVATLEGEIDRLQDMVINVDQPQIRKLEDKRLEFRHKKSVAQAVITQKNKDLTEARAELEKCKRQLSDAHLKNAKKGITGVADLDRPLRIHSLASSAQQAISNSYDEFVQKMRESVSDSANGIFSSLISDAGYRGLMINKNFGLSLLNEEEKIVDLRSSGQSQVVAVSLILALHECAVRTGTLLMDTPFGRLDLTHRTNLMNYFTSNLPQVVLLIQSGELDDDDLSEWADFTSRRYKLERGSTTAETIIREV